MQVFAEVGGGVGEGELECRGLPAVGLSAPSGVAVVTVSLRRCHLSGWGPTR